MLNVWVMNHEIDLYVEHGIYPVQPVIDLSGPFTEAQDTIAPRPNTYETQTNNKHPNDPSNMSQFEKSCRGRCRCSKFCWFGW